MTPLQHWLRNLPPPARWGVLAGVGILVALVAGAGTWALIQRRDAQARLAVGAASASYRQAMSGGEDAPLASAATTLRQFLKDYPRSSVAAEAWYRLGNLEYRRRDFDAALAAFNEAARRARGSLGALSRLGAGYAWEAKGDAASALDAYRGAIEGRGPKDFLYVEAMLAVGRAQEQLKQTPAAIETYRRLLKDVPDAPRADEVRSRLAALGAGA